LSGSGDECKALIEGRPEEDQRGEYHRDANGLSKTDADGVKSVDPTKRAFWQG
jgi:hypothetical protein